MGLRPFHRFAEKGNDKQVKLLLQKEPGLVFDQTNDGDTALHFAAWQGHVHVAITLAEAGADVNARGDRGFTPLHCSAYHGTPKVAELGIEAGAELNTPDASGLTPIFHAARGRANRPSMWPA